MSAAFDVIVIGAGHNGLACAAYLAKAGRQVLVLEAASAIGGAAANTEIAPGFTVSACAHILHSLHPKVIADLELTRHGLAFSASDMPTVALDAEADHVILRRDQVTDSLRAHNTADAAALPAFYRRFVSFAATLQPFLTAVPPRLGGGRRRDRLTLIKLGWAVRKLGRREMREILRVIGMNIADILEETFESDLVKGALALDGVLGTNFGPRSPGSVFTMLYRLAGEAEGLRGALAHPRGGMGAVAQALAVAAQKNGAEIRSGTPVARILVEDDRACGVELQSGERFAARVVVSNADPRATFLTLLGPEYLDTGFVRRISNLRQRGLAAKLNLALDGLPSFAGLNEAELGGRLVIAPGIDYLERAFNHSKYGEYSEHPAVEITIPSIHDRSLAPEGKHVLSAVIQYAPYGLKQSWDEARDAFADKVIETIAAYAPDLPGRIVARQTVTPLDLEREYRMTGGHWHHGDLALDQLLMLRPVPGAAQYATPLSGLYLCGAGAHPGGGVMGAAGRNAAQQVMAMERAA
jgi:phytoene dehydrogenase-like protein